MIAEKGRNDVVEPSQGLLEFLRWLIEKRRKDEIALVVFDTLSSMTAGLPENRAEAMSIVTEILDKIAKACFAAVDVLHHTAKQSRETGAFAPRGSGVLGAAARSIRTIELAAEGGSRLLKVRPLKLSNRGRGQDDHFEIQVWKRQVERARRRGQFRMAGVAGLRRLTAAALHQAKATWDADLSRKVVDALKVATENGTRLRVRNRETEGQGCARSVDNAVGACRACARRKTGRSEEDTARPRNKRRPAPQASSGRCRESELSRNSSLRAMQPAAKPPTLAPIRNFDSAWIRSNFPHRRWVGSTTKSASAVRRMGGVPKGGDLCGRVRLRRFSLGGNLR